MSIQTIEWRKCKTEAFATKLCAVINGITFSIARQHYKRSWIAFTGNEANASFIGHEYHEMMYAMSACSRTSGIGEGHHRWIK